MSDTMSLSPLSVWFVDTMHDPTVALCYKLKCAKELLTIMHDPHSLIEQRIECAIILLHMQALGIIGGKPPWECDLSLVPHPSSLIH
jgi:hypothetical protein